METGITSEEGGNETSRFSTILEWPKEIPGGHKPGRNHDRVMPASDRCGWHHDHGDRGHVVVAHIRTNPCSLRRRAGRHSSHIRVNVLEIKSILVVVCGESRKSERL